MQRGGFDVIVGNPPYVASSKISYLSPEQKLLRYPDIYGIVMKRSLSLVSREGRCGMIVPLSLTFSEDFGGLRTSLATHGTCWFSSFDNIPAAVFSGVSQRCTIWISANEGKDAYSSPMYRWRSAARPNLVDGLAYTPIAAAAKGTRGIPKVGSLNSLSVLNSVTAPKGTKKREIFSTGRVGGARVGFSQAARNFVSVFRENPPCLDAATLREVAASKIGDLKFANEESANAALASLLGESYFHYWLVQGDGFDVTGWVLKDYLACLNYLEVPDFEMLIALGKILHSRRHEALAFKKNAGKYVGNFNYRTLHEITRRSDLVMMMGLKITPQAALKILNDVQRVLAINEFAGERGIPAAVKEVLKPLPRDLPDEERVLSLIDAALLRYLDLTNPAYEFLLKRDVVLYEAVVEGEMSEANESDDE